MHEKFTRLTPELYSYLVAHATPRPAVLDELEAETAALGTLSVMQIAAEQGALLTLLTHLLGARRAVEVGTFTGYSAICIARGLAPGGRLLCCETNPEWIGIAQRHFERAGLADRIEVQLGPAIDTLRGLPREESLDIAFIDADKVSYAAYYEEVLARLRPGGLVLFDNVLWLGSVIDSADSSPDTQAIRRLNDRLRDDRRVDAVMLPIADGLTIARKL